MRFVTAKPREVALDLVKSTGATGMTVSAVTCDGKSARFIHVSNRLQITLTQPATAGGELSCTTTYRGIPAAGLRIINNIHGERTAFSENWPDNARHWLPMIDHPYDKLNQFVYQKGGWTLHMLRYQLGTERFWDGIREYYRRYQNQNGRPTIFGS